MLSLVLGRVLGYLMLSQMVRSLLSRSSESGGHLTSSDNEPPNVKKAKKMRCVPSSPAVDLGFQLGLRPVNKGMCDPLVQ